MKTDYRKTFYDSYVSTFKTEHLDTDPQVRKDALLGVKHRFGPIFKDFNRDLSILEIGCGPGYLIEYLAKLGFKDVMGIDVSEEQINLARSKGLNAKNADAIDYLSEINSKYDIIIAIDLIEHLHRGELIELFRFVNLALHTGGMVVIHTPNGEGLFPQHVIYGDLTHSTIFTENSLKQLLHLTGFEKITMQETGPIPKNLKGIIRVFLWKFITLIAKIIRLIEAGKYHSIWTENILCTAVKLGSNKNQTK